MTHERSHRRRRTSRWSSHLHLWSSLRTGNSLVVLLTHEQWRRFDFRILYQMIPRLYRLAWTPVLSWLTRVFAEKEGKNAGRTSYIRVRTGDWCSWVLFIWEINSRDWAWCRDSRSSCASPSWDISSTAWPISLDNELIGNNSPKYLRNLLHFIFWLLSFFSSCTAKSTRSSAWIHYPPMGSPGSIHLFYSANMHTHRKILSWSISQTPFR